MTRLGLTQRVEVIEDYGERRDCLDQAWTTLLEGWGYQPIPLPNTVNQPSRFLDSMDLDGIILTSGNDLAHLDNPTQPAPERDEFERKILEWALDRSVPVLGVCRGLELINDYFGGSLSTIQDHVATEHSVAFEVETLELSRSAELYFPTEIQVNSYHNYGISPEEVAKDLTLLATAPDQTAEAFFHPKHPLLGIMWHPERDARSTSFDHKLFDALFTSINQ